jgi:hypothetical protein
MKRIETILLFIPCFIAGLIGVFGSFIFWPLFILFNLKYKLPDDKAGIDVIPIISHCWRLYVWYMKKYFGGWL